MHLLMCLGIYRYKYTYTHTHIYIISFIYVFIYIYIYMCMNYVGGGELGLFAKVPSSGI